MHHKQPFPHDHRAGARRVVRVYPRVRAVSSLPGHRDAATGRDGGSLIGLVQQHHLTTLAAAIVLVLTATLTGGCDKKSGAQSAVSPTAPSFPGASISEAVLVGAGDINMCGQPGAEATAKLLDDIPGTVFTSGDNAYMKGSDGRLPVLRPHLGPPQVAHLPGSRQPRVRVAGRLAVLRVLRRARRPVRSRVLRVRSRRLARRLAEHERADG